MDITGRVALITGAGGGIGEALAIALAQASARVVVSDLSADAAARVAEAITAAGGEAVAIGCDVADESAIKALVGAALERFGRIDIFCSNAGIMCQGGPEADDAIWDRSWRVNVMAHVFAARACLPLMIAQGEGYLVNMSSAAGILTALGAAPYAVTKHAAFGFSEWLAITYADQGVRTSVVCPQTVDTPMLAATLVGEAANSAKSAGRVISAQDAAAAIVEGIREEAPLILPHPEVARYFRQKADDPQRWQKSMRKFLSAQGA